MTTRRSSHKKKNGAQKKAPKPEAKAAEVIPPRPELPGITNSLGCVDEGRKHLAHVLVVLREIEFLAPWLGKLAYFAPSRIADGTGADWTFSRKGIEENSKFLAENLQDVVGTCIDALRAFNVVETEIRDIYEAVRS